MTDVEEAKSKEDTKTKEGGTEDTEEKCKKEEEIKWCQDPSDFHGFAVSSNPLKVFFWPRRPKRSP